MGRVAILLGYPNFTFSSYILGFWVLTFLPLSFSSFTSYSLYLLSSLSSIFTHSHDQHHALPYSFSSLTFNLGSANCEIHRAINFIEIRTTKSQQQIRTARNQDEASNSSRWSVKFAIKCSEKMKKILSNWYMFNR